MPRLKQQKPRHIVGSLLDVEDGSPHNSEISIEISSNDEMQLQIDERSSKSTSPSSLPPPPPLRHDSGSSKDGSFLEDNNSNSSSFRDEPSPCSTSKSEALDTNEEKKQNSNSYRKGKNLSSLHLEDTFSIPETSDLCEKTSSYIKFLRNLQQNKSSMSPEDYMAMMKNMWNSLMVNPMMKQFFLNNMLEGQSSDGEPRVDKQKELEIDFDDESRSLSDVNIKQNDIYMKGKLSPESLNNTKTQNEGLSYTKTKQEKNSLVKENFARNDFQIKNEDKNISSRNRQTIRDEHFLSRPENIKLVNSQDPDSQTNNEAFVKWREQILKYREDYYNNWMKQSYVGSFNNPLPLTSQSIGGQYDNKLYRNSLLMWPGYGLQSGYGSHNNLFPLTNSPRMPTFNSHKHEYFETNYKSNSKSPYSPTMQKDLSPQLQCSPKNLTSPHASQSYPQLSNPSKDPLSSFQNAPPPYNTFALNPNISSASYQSIVQDLRDEDSFKSKKSRSRSSAVHSIGDAIVREAKQQLKGVDPENMYIPCPICHKRIKRLYHFQRHMRIHSGEKSHHCTYCPYKSVRKDNLKSHMKTHEKHNFDPSKRSPRNHAHSQNNRNVSPGVSSSYKPQMYENSNTTRKSSNVVSNPYSLPNNMMAIENKPDETTHQQSLSLTPYISKYKDSSATFPKVSSESYSLSAPNHKNLYAFASSAYPPGVLRDSPPTISNGRISEVKPPTISLYPPSNEQDVNSTGGIFPKRKAKCISDLEESPKKAKISVRETNIKDNLMNENNSNNQTNNTSPHSTQISFSPSATNVNKKKGTKNEVINSNSMTNQDIKEENSDFPQQGNNVKSPNITLVPLPSSDENSPVNNIDEEGVENSSLAQVPERLWEKSDSKVGLKKNENNAVASKKATSPASQTFVTMSSDKGVTESVATTQQSEGQDFKCKVCSFKSSSLTTLQNHMFTHKIGGYYKCQECNYHGKNLSKLVEHNRIHTGERPFRCDQCSYAAKRKDNLAQHKNVKHKVNNAQISSKLNKSYNEIETFMKSPMVNGFGTVFPSSGSKSFAYPSIPSSLLSAAVGMKNSKSLVDDNGFNINFSLSVSAPWKNMEENQKRIKTEHIVYENKNPTTNKSASSVDRSSNKKDISPGYTVYGQQYFPYYPYVQQHQPAYPFFPYVQHGDVDMANYLTYHPLKCDQLPRRKQSSASLKSVSPPPPAKKVSKEEQDLYIQPILQLSGQAGK